MLRPRVVKLGTAVGVGAIALWTFDESLGLRPWKRVHHVVNSPSLATPMQLVLDAITRPPPISCIDWPAGRVLLQWALDNLPKNSTTLEIGSGIGTTAVGLAMASKSAGANSTIIATDIDEDALNLLMANAELNEVSLVSSQWDCAGGEQALSELPVDPATLSHGIGSDLVYYGGAHDVGSDKPGLVSTLAALLRVQPRLEITLLCIARAPVVVPTNADEPTPSSVAVARPTEPPQEFLPLESFERACKAQGLRAIRLAVPTETVARVSASQWPWLRVAWWMCGIWDSMVLYRVVAR
tara:strand:- start:2677 stop:3567 length:891 start_codon:yes stop_codon:yes gene_type:complete